MAYMFILLSIIREIVSARAEKNMKIFQIKKNDKFKIITLAAQLNQFLQYC